MVPPHCSLLWLLSLLSQVAAELAHGFISRLGVTESTAITFLPLPSVPRLPSPTEENRAEAEQTESGRYLNYVATMSGRLGPVILLHAQTNVMSVEL